MMMRLVVALVLFALPACTAPNPDFEVTPAAYRAQVAQMKAAPAPLERPLVVLDGWRQPWLSADGVRDRMLGLTGADRSQAIAISYPFVWSIPAAARYAVDEIEHKWPSDDPDETVEVDVIGYSMGGIVARYAADMWKDLPPESRPAKRLRLRRLYTIATPHRGARLARWLPLDASAWAMRPTSVLLDRLDAARRDASYELVCYAQTNDVTVGARNAAPPGMEPIWTPGTLLASHFTSRINPHILLDIALRLRGEEPLAGEGSRPPRN